MTKKILSLVALLLLVIQLTQGQNNIKQSADDAYKTANYREAVERYEEILGQGVESHEVYYNLGCAYYRLDELGKAIVNFERANKMKHNDKATQENLALAYSRTSDKIKEKPQFFLAQWWNNLITCFSSSTWYGILLVMILLLATVVVWFLLSCEMQTRRITLLVSFILLLLTATTTACAITSSSHANSHNEAIIVVPYASVKSAPQQDGVERFALHEGTKVYIEEIVEHWYHVSIADGNSGWIESTNIERI